MREIYIIALTVGVLFTFLTGCESNEMEKIDNENKIFKVSISNSVGFERVNPNYFVENEDEAVLEVFNNVIPNAERVAGFVDVAEPEFDLKVEYEKGYWEGYHLWLGEKGQKSTLMKTIDTNTIYTVSEELTEQLIELVEK